MLWAAFYLSKKRLISRAIFDFIKAHSQKTASAFSIQTNVLKDLIYLVKEYRGTPMTQIQTNQVLHGTSANFFNCVESTLLDMINFGLFSNPDLVQRITFDNLKPHWSKHKEYRKIFFESTEQSYLIKADIGTQVKEAYAKIFKNIAQNINAKTNWTKVSQDIPGISYSNFYIFEKKMPAKAMVMKYLLK